MRRLCVLVSGNGTTLQAIIDAVASGEVDGEICGVISSNPNAYAIVRAKKSSLPVFTIDYRSLGKGQYDEMLFDKLSQLSPDLICLAGYLKILNSRTVEQFRGRIINIHPALLPLFGGKGMYGNRVHEAVLRSGASETGCSVHFVTDSVDAGPVILQVKVPVLEGDTVDSLGYRVHAAEIRAYPEAIRRVLDGKASID